MLILFQMSVQSTEKVSFVLTRLDFNKSIRVFLSASQSEGGSKQLFQFVTFYPKFESLSTDVYELRTQTGMRIFSSLGCVMDLLIVTSTYNAKMRAFQPIRVVQNAF